MIDVARLPLEGRGGLIEVLKTIQDPRKKRGVRHRAVSILAIAAAAMLSGVKSFVAMAEWAENLSKENLKRLGYPPNRTPPSEPTLRRMLQRLDVDEFEKKISAWWSRRISLEKHAIALDGKTIKGTKEGDKPAIHQLSAVVHGKGVVIAQTLVPAETNEITTVPALLDPLNIEGLVVTADALHTQAETARYIVEEKKADYLFTVKGNQPGLLDEIKSLAMESFSPSASVSGDQQGSRPDRDPQDLDELGA